MKLLIAFAAAIALFVLPSPASSAPIPGTAELRIEYARHSPSLVANAVFDVVYFPIGATVAYVPNGGIWSINSIPRRLSITMRPSNDTVIGIACTVEGTGGSTSVAYPAARVVVLDVKADDLVHCRFDTVPGTVAAPINPYPYYVPGGAIGYAPQR